MRLKNPNEVGKFMDAVRKTDCDVYLVSTIDDTRLNLKSELSLFIGIGKILEDFGEQFELFASRPGAEGHLLKFFADQDKGRF